MGSFFSTQRSIEYLPAEAVGVVAAEPGFRPSRLAKWASKASNKLLGAYKIHSFLANKFPIKVEKKLNKRKKNTLAKSGISAFSMPTF